MYPEAIPLFKEIMPYSNQIDQNNRWINLSKLVPWQVMEVIYLKHFHPEKHKKVKKCRLMMGLMLGQMLLEQSNVAIVEYFHENPYFQYFCGQDTFVPKREKAIIHHSLLTKRRTRLGKTYISQFEKEVLEVLKEKGLIKGERLILDATVFPANISYPNDVKLLNATREWCCEMILRVKNSVDPSRKVRTYRRSARRVYLNFQKRKRKTKAFIRKSRNQMRRFLKRNIAQLNQLMAEVDIQIKAEHHIMKKWMISQIKAQLEIAVTIYEQQTQMAKTRGHRIANRIVNFKQPLIRPIIRGKEGRPVEFGPKAQVAVVDGYAILDDCQFDNFNEGIRLRQSLEKHEERFQRKPDLVLADQLYANRENRALLKEHDISHSFKQTGRPSKLSKEALQKQRATFKKRQGQRNHIEGLFGHLKDHFYLDKIRWTVPDGAHMQIQLGLIASNLHRAAARI